MKSKHLLWMAPWIAFGLGACATVPRTATSKACAEWRWIGIKSQAEADNACPDIPGWEEEPLFPSPAAAELRPETVSYGQERTALAAPDPKVQAEAVPLHGKEKRIKPTSDPKVVQELKRFCVYKKNPWGGSSPPAANGKLVRLDQDCAAVTIAGGPSNSKDWRDFYNQFLAQAGKPETPLVITNRQGVRLAFLDTQPTGRGVPSKRPKGWKVTEHGYTLAHIARNLICSPADTESCAALITTRLALPIRHFSAKSRFFTKISKERGGRIGLQSDLADAIRAEVDEWWGELGKQDAPQRLVLNLSVGWDGDLLDGLSAQQVSDLRAGTQAVYWALRYAADLDVLVLAAAGNRKQGCPSEGPLLPAAWEDGAPPEVCGEARRTATTPPLLYAVGGVNWEGKPMEMARDRGMPPRAAFGEYAVVPALARKESTNMYTGTSVSTAVVSSIAAIVWDTLPDRSSSGIMNLLYDSGDDLSPQVADFGLASRAVHRISLCSALKKACGGQPGCPLQSECAPWPPQTAVEPEEALKLKLASILRSCHPWVHTQPPDDPCPICEPPRN